MARWYFTNTDDFTARKRFHDHRSCFFLAKLTGQFEGLKKNETLTRRRDSSPTPKCQACNLRIDCNLEDVEELYKKREQRGGRVT